MRPILLFLLLTSLAQAQTLKVAVIDTGLSLNDPRFAGHICSTEHKDFTGTSLDDVNSHGTHVSGLIVKNAGDGDYCLQIYKYYTDSQSGAVNLKHEVEAIREAINNKANIVNMSGGGPEFNEEEALLIKYHPEIIFVVAAGNDGKDLDISGNSFYPASLFYGNIEVVMALDREGNRIRSSNYGKKIENKELGENVYSYLPNGKMGYMTGTSQATATFTGKLIRKTLDAK